MKQNRFRNEVCLFKKAAIVCTFWLLILSLQTPAEARIVKQSANFEDNYNDFDDMGSPGALRDPRTQNKPNKENNAELVGIELNRKSNKVQPGKEMTEQEIQEYFTKYGSSDKSIMSGRAGPGRKLDCEGNKRWSNVLKKCVAVVKLRESGKYSVSRGSVSALQNVRHRNKKYKIRTAYY